MPQAVRSALLATLVILAGCPPAPDLVPEATPDCWPDRDRDGFGDQWAVAAPCGSRAQEASVAGDCLDIDAAIHPGVPELCDGLDGDCDGVVPTNETDADADGARVCDGDCDDGDPALVPGASEACNGIDDDCDGTLPSAESTDSDSDGVLACADCDDQDSSAGAALPEVCNGLDDDCDGALPTDEVDADGDGAFACLDCLDSDPEVRPGAPELCDGLDNDCDGVIPLVEVDGDGDGALLCADCDDADPAVSPLRSEACNGIDDNCDGLLPWDDRDTDGDGLIACAGDCDDSNPLVSVGAVEICDGLDNDCDGVIPALELDGDGDGWSPCTGDCDDAEPLVAPEALPRCDGMDTDCDGQLDPEETDLDGDGFSLCAGDCREGAPTIAPGAPELCNGIDDDCDGAPETTCQPTTPCPDLDQDGFDSCTGGDCDDTDPAVYPDALETCDGIDSDCSGSAEGEGDLDGDGLMDCELLSWARSFSGWGAAIVSGLDLPDPAAAGCLVSGGITGGFGPYFDPIIVYQPFGYNGTVDGAWELGGPCTTSFGDVQGGVSVEHSIDAWDWPGTGSLDQSFELTGRGLESDGWQTSVGGVDTALFSGASGDDSAWSGGWEPGGFLTYGQSTATNLFHGTVVPGFAPAGGAVGQWLDPAAAYHIDRRYLSIDLNGTDEVSLSPGPSNQIAESDGSLLQDRGTVEQVGGPVASWRLDGVDSSWSYSVTTSASGSFGCPLEPVGHIRASVRDADGLVLQEQRVDFEGIESCDGCGTWSVDGAPQGLWCGWSF